MQVPYAEKNEIKTDIYADDYLFSANLTVFKPRVMKVFLWESETGPSAAGTEEFFYPCEDAATPYDCNIPPDNTPDCAKIDNVYQCKGICMNGTKIVCDDGSSFVSEQPTIPKLEDDTSCKNNIDNNCNNLVGCFGGAGLTRTANWEPLCDGIIATYAGCTSAGCVCQTTEGQDSVGGIPGPSCRDGFDNDGDGCIDSKDPTACNPGCTTDAIGCCL